METLYQTADAEISLSDSGCRRLSIRLRIQETVYQIADAGDYQTAGAEESLSDCGCRSIYIRQFVWESDPLSDKVSPASAV